MEETRYLPGHIPPPTPGHSPETNTGPQMIQTSGVDPVLGPVQSRNREVGPVRRSERVRRPLVRLDL